MFAEAAEIATAIGDKRHILFALAGLGRVAYREERWEDAGTHARESLRLAQELGMKLPAVEEILWLAGIATSHGRHGAGCAARSRRRNSTSRFSRPDRRPTIADYQDDHRARESGLRPGDVGSRPRSEGRAMTVDEGRGIRPSSA